jgi:energy-coupling factor transporter transmembrane protein EcfT
MSQTLVTTGLIVASILAAWLRFDLGWYLLSWLFVLLCIAGAFAAWIARGRRLPPVQLPRSVEELGGREALTREEETRFADSLRAWHHRQQRSAWDEIVRGGPGPLVAARTAFHYLWLSFFALALLPPSVVPASLLPGLPRFLVVLLPLAAVSLAAAAPLGLRDWRRARKALSEEGELA